MSITHYDIDITYRSANASYTGKVSVSSERTKQEIYNVLQEFEQYLLENVNKEEGNREHGTIEKLIVMRIAEVKGIKEH